LYNHLILSKNSLLDNLIAIHFDVLPIHDRLKDKGFAQLLMTACGSQTCKESRLLERRADFFGEFRLNNLNFACEKCGTGT
jgi:hypothetical protein